MIKRLHFNKRFLPLLMTIFLCSSMLQAAGSDPIAFSDANVKNICVANWDTNGDGELSYTEAAAVTTLNNAFSFDDAITSFDELQYFTGLTSLNSYEFYFCSSLSSISLPNTVTLISDEAFSGCIGLSSITSLAATPPTLGNNVFDGVPNTVIVNVLSCSIDDYQSATGWNSFSNYDEIFSDSCPIPFADDNVKAICVANWDTNGDGELSYAEAVAVTDLGSYFQNNTTITSFDELQYFTALTSIRNSAFYCCKSLTSIEIPNSVTSIGGNAFYFCSSLTSIEIPNSVTSIGQYAFYNCSSLTSIEIPNSVTSIGGFAFSFCNSLTSIEIPNSVTSIGTNPFGCSGLVQITVDNSNTVYDSRDNCNAIIETSTNVLITGCKNTVIPNSVISIGQYAFSGCSSLTSIEIPNSVTSIGNYAFSNCNRLTSIEIPNSVTSIGSYAFSYCNSLTSIELPNSVTSIGNSAFRGCINLTYIEIPNSVTSIVDYAFFDCNSLTSIELPNSVTSIGQYAFYKCNRLTSIEIPNSVTSIGQYAFYKCNSLTSIEIPNSVTSIGQYAFSYCSSLTSIEIPNSVTSIGNSAFDYCIRLTYIEIHNSGTSIGSYAFCDCSSLTSIIIYANTPPTVGNTTFYGVPYSTLVYVPCGTSGVYQSTSGWNYFSSFEEFIAGDYCTIDFVDDNVKAICVAQWDTNGDGELSYAEAAAVTNLGTYFKNNTTITSFDELQYFTGVTTLQGMAFMGCTNLTSISLPSSMESLNAGTLFNCTSLATMTVYAETPPTVASTTFNNVPTNLILYVPCGTSAAYQAATGWSNFSNIVDMCTYHFAIPGSWSVATNWTEGSVPGTATEVIINANCKLDTDATVDELTINNGGTLTINSNKTLTVTTTLTNNDGSASKLVINDGGQLVNPSSGVSGTKKKQITGYGLGNDGWYTVSSPIYNSISTYVLTTGNYDLYAYDEPTAMWLNQKVPGNFDDGLNPAQGYLYASQTGRTANFAGQLNASNAEISIPVTYTSGELAGFNLVGNPYTNNINIGDVQINGTAQTAFYRAEGGNNLVAYVAADNEPIKPCEGFFVQATGNGTLTFGSTAKRGYYKEGSYLRLVLNKGDQVADRAYLRMDSGETLEKIITSNANSMLYFMNGYNRYAVAENETYSNSMPLYLENAFGRYTIEASLLNTQCDYLHLIDNITGDNIDLLKTPSYTFMSSPRDRDDRFTLVFNAFEDVDNEVFAYQNGDDIVISGNGELQIFDVMGRMVATQRVNGVETVEKPSQTGVYIFRLVGNEVKSQKIVVD